MPENVQIVNGCAVSPAVWSGWVGGSRQVWPCDCESPTEVGECAECRGFPVAVVSHA